MLTSMITPAVLISSAGTLVFSTSSRLSRVVDRVRSLAETIEKAATTGPPLESGKRALILDQLGWLSQRVLRLRTAMTSFYVAIGLLVATSMAIGLVAVAELSAWEFVPLVFGISGSAALLWGSLLLIAEARIAVTSTLQEMRYVRDAVEKYRLAGEDGNTKPGV